MVPATHKIQYEVKHIFQSISAAQESNETLMKELRGKAEFFQNYIMERYKKLSDVRTVGTNTEDRNPILNNTNIETEVVQEHDESLEEKVYKLVVL